MKHLDYTNYYDKDLSRLPEDEREFWRKYVIPHLVGGPIAYATWGERVDQDGSDDKLLTMQVSTLRTSNR